MKNIRFLSSVFGVLLLMGISDCKQATPQPKTELEKLPPATQLGKYTFGCLVNGKAMVPDNTLDVSATYQFNRLQLLGRVEIDGVYQALIFLIDDSNLSEKKYLLNDTLLQNCRYKYLDGKITCDYTTDGGIDNNGEIIITKFDKTNLIVSGVFSLTVSPPVAQNS